MCFFGYEMYKNSSSRKTKSFTDFFKKSSSKSIDTYKTNSDANIKSSTKTFFKNLFKKKTPSLPKIESVSLNIPSQRERDDILNYQHMEILCNETRKFNEKLTTTMFKQNQYIFSLFILFIILALICSVFFTIILLKFYKHD
jgi:hypothetical protein